MNAKSIWTRPIAAAALLAGVGLVAFGAGGAGRLFSSNPPATLHLADAREPASGAGFAAVVKRTLPSVVNIASSKVVREPAGGRMDPLFEQFFGGAPRASREQGLGSGVIVSPEGYVLTNNHVIDGATQVRVTLSDKREFEARVIGADAKTDIAVLRIAASDLQPIVIGDSSKTRVGDYALAIGNPFGVGQTVTMGIISATRRNNLGIEDYEDFIQTDAPINPGNSGGALVNDRGELIGINTAIISHGAEGSQGIGFAVPANLVRQVMDEILKNGRVVRAYLGIVPQDVTPAIARAFGVKEPRGALVGDVSENGPAQKSGIQKGDIVLEVDGQPVADSGQLRMGISMMQPDATVRLKVLRDGAEREIAVQLAELPGQRERAATERDKSDDPLEGISVRNLDRAAAQRLGISPNTTGVVVTDIDPGSPAADSDLQPGDVIVQLNRKPIAGLSDFEKIPRKAPSENLLLVNRRGNTVYVTV